jgi:hypothetical protein
MPQRRPKTDLLDGEVLLQFAIVHGTSAFLNARSLKRRTHIARYQPRYSSVWSI